MKTHTSEYYYASAEPTWSNQYLWPPLRDILESRLQAGNRIMDLGCGGGATAAMLAESGFSVTAVDPSVTGIRVATEAYPGVRFAERSAYDDLSDEFGEFDAVISLEVVEHCCWPRLFAKSVLSLLRPGGLAVISTPFHGYWKNLALALAGRFDVHWSPLWDGGHIKFWSENTLRALLDEVGFVDIEFQRVGRIPPLARSMIATARKSK
jgi:2-polyprenyl-6-hydroxyphenyl methylase/3-demethylubiquinone-9 3-methyltransferase